MYTRTPQKKKRRSSTHHAPWTANMERFHISIPAGHADRPIHSIGVYSFTAMINGLGWSTRSLIDGRRPSMHISCVQLELVERGGVAAVVVIIGFGAVSGVHVKIVVGQQEFGRVEDHIVDHVRGGHDVGGRHGPGVRADKVHGRAVAVHAAAHGVIHVLLRHRVHQVQRVGAVFRLDGGVLQLLLDRKLLLLLHRKLLLLLLLVIADVVTTAVLLHHHRIARLLLLLRLQMVMMHRGRRLMVVVVGRRRRLVVLPSVVAAAAGAALTTGAALVDGAAAQVQDGGRRTLVVSGRRTDGVLSRRRRRVLQLEHVVVVGGGGRRLQHRLTAVHRRRRLRPGHEPKVHDGRHVLDRRRLLGLELLQHLVVLQPRRRRRHPVLVVVVVVVQIVITATAAAAMVVIVVMVVVMTMR